MSLYEQSHSTLGEMAQSSNDKHYELPSIVSDRSDDFDANQLDDSKVDDALYRSSLIDMSLSFV